MKSLYPILAILLCGLPIFASTPAHEKPIKIQLRLSATDADDSLRIQYYDPYTLEYLPGTDGSVEYYKLPTKKDLTINANSVTIVNIQMEKGGYFRFMFLMPGDEVAIKADKNGIQVSGPGSRTYDFFYKELYPKFDQLALPSPKKYADPTNIGEMRAWNEYLDKKSKILYQSIAQYSSEYPSPVWDIVKAAMIASIENERHGKFFTVGLDKEKYGLTQVELKKMYYSEIYNDNLKWLLSSKKELPNLEQLYRVFATINLVENDIDDRENTALYEDPYSNYLNIFDLIDSTTEGRLTDQLKTYFLFSRAAHGGNTKLAGDLAEKIYPTLSSSEYKSIIQKGLAAYALESSSGGMFTDFLLLDENGNQIKGADHGDKIFLFHFSERGKLADNHFFQSAYKKYGHKKEIIFAAVSGKGTFEEWRKQVRKMKKDANIHQWYAPHSGDHRDLNILDKGPDSLLSMLLYPKGGYHANIFAPYMYIKKFKISNTDSARLRFLDRYFALGPNDRKISSNDKKNNPNDKKLFLNDGPYVFYQNDTAFVYNIRNASAAIDTLVNTKVPEQAVLTNSGHHFTIPIRSAAVPPPALYQQPSKMLVLSDLEGNFESFREFLINHKIIDTAYNWTYGDGHLVITGDMMDRGKEVTQCLWLAYSLEEKAEKAGGYVHFILGNHEIMNMTGEYSYVSRDYFISARMFKREYSDLLSGQSVLGQWLRSKNIMEKIGDNLIVHGGISAEVNALELPVIRLNELHHSILNSLPISAENKKPALTLANSQVAPYWYRGYYNSSSTPEVELAIIDNTLQLYKVKRIITGHTIVQDIVSFFDGKVINTDTHHASGDSEGLIIEGTNLYRALFNGNKEPLQ
ncbi:metallophosphoesterase [Chitinophaga sp. YIM B06452]|uniref:metallophosphoesterase n=1 Tax=Chitinophaga sp. YIM B06452 TaxID=3082158 RepID=UPI0031FEDF1A